MLRLVKGSPNESFLGNFPIGESNDHLDLALSCKAQDGTRAKWRFFAALRHDEVYAFSDDARRAWQDLVKTSNWRESSEGPFEIDPRIIW